MLPGLDDPGLLGGDVALGRPGELVVVHADVGDDGDLRVAHVGGVPPTEHADLDHCDIDREVGEPSERGRRRRLEVRRPHAREHLEIGDGRDLLGELVVADVLAVAAHPLVGPFEVRAGVRTDRQPMRHQQPGDHLRRRSLAVGPGHMDHRVGELRIAHRRDDASSCARSSATRSARSSRSWRGRRGTPARRSRSSVRCSAHSAAPHCRVSWPRGEAAWPWAHEGRAWGWSSSARCRPRS